MSLEPPATSPSAAKVRSGGAGCLAAFGAVFLLAGIGLLIPFFLLPAQRAWAARSWREAPCTVLESRVETASGDESDTYRVAVVFEYRVDGRTYRSDRYDFLGGSSSGQAGKQAVVDRNPPGTRTVCWVDPADPTEAVFSRAWRAGWLAGLVPLLLAGAGGGVMLLAWKTARDARAPATPVPRRIARELAAGPVTLRPRATRLGALALSLVVALFWNGIVSVFVWQLVQQWRETRHFDGCLVLFLLPFVVIGLLFLAAIPYAFLALFNPRLTLTLSRAVLAPGDSVHLEWRFGGFPGRIRRLRIALEGRQQGVQPSKPFATVVVVDTEERSLIPQGSRLLGVAADARPSGEEAVGRVSWVLAVRGTIGFWPDVNEEFELEVLPRE